MNGRSLLPVLAMVWVCSIPGRLMGQATEIVVETYAENIGMVGTTDLTGYNTYRIYVKFASDQDFLTAVYGDVQFPTRIQGGDNFFNSAFGGKDNEGYNPALFAVFPDLEFDSFITIGMDAPAVVANGQAAINAVGDPLADWIPEFEPGGGAVGSDIIMDTQTGGAWFPIFPNTNAYAGEDSLVLIGQFTTDTTLYGVISVATFVGGVQSNDDLVQLPFSSSPNAVFGCTDSNATNYDMGANEDNGSCVYTCDYPATQLMVTGTSSNSVSCSGYSDGFASVTVSGGQGSLTYSNGTSSNATGLFSGVVAGDLTITVTDNVGCSVEAMVSVDSPEVLNVMASLSDPISCNGESDAVLSGNSTGGTGVITYGLQAPIDTGNGGLPFLENGTETLLFENIGVGLYTVYAVDENGCLDNTPGISVDQPQTFNLYAEAIVPSSCEPAQDGVVVLNYFGGSGNSATYSQEGLSFSEANTFFVAPGTYTFYAQDQNGCLDTLSNVVVEGTGQIELDVEITPPSCSGGADGILLLFPDGGSTSLEVVFDGEVVSPSLPVTGLSAGTYSVFVSDDAGCESEFEVAVEDLAEVMLEVAVLQDAPCSGGTGDIGLFAAGGVGPYTVSGTFGNDTFDPDFPLMGVPTGSGTVTILDANGCEASSPFFIGEPEALTVELESIQPTTPGNSEGNITVDISGGTPPYTTFWTRDDGVVVSSAQNPSGLSAGLYSLALTDANGCSLTVPGFMVTQMDVEGCTDTIAINFNPGATLDDGSCVYPNCEDLEVAEVDLAAILPGTLDGTFGVLMERELLLLAGNIVIEPSTGTQYTLLQFSPDTAFGVPAGLDLGGDFADLGAGEALCMTLQGTPVETGVFLVTIEGETVVSVFGLPFAAGRTAVSFTINILENANPIAGCTYPNAANYLVFATADDGSCLMPGCMDPEAVNHSPHFNVSDDSCVYASEFGGFGGDVICRADFDDSGLVGAADLLIFLSAFENVCAE